MKLLFIKICERWGKHTEHNLWWKSMPRLCSVFWPSYSENFHLARYQTTNGLTYLRQIDLNSYIVLCYNGTNMYLSKTTTKKMQYGNKISNLHFECNAPTHGMARFSSGSAIIRILTIFIFYLFFFLHLEQRVGWISMLFLFASYVYYFFFFSCILFTDWKMHYLSLHKDIKRWNN